MKFRLPQTATRLSHAGKAVAIAADGTLELDPAAIALLAPHGIAPLGDPLPIDPTRIASMTRADLEAALAARGVAIPAETSDAGARGLLRRTLAKPAR